MDKFMLYMLIAGKKALEDGGFTKELAEELDKTKCGVLIGSAMGGMKVIPIYMLDTWGVVWRVILPICDFYLPYIGKKITCKIEP